MAELGQKIRKIQEDAAREALEILTGEQKENFEKRQGKSFK
jgi:hypothetical protein